MEIFKTHEIINGLVRETGVDSSRQNLFFRFPYGNGGSIYNYAACRKILASLGYRVAWWDLDTWDWRMELGWFKKNSTKVIASLKKAKPRDVVLLHDRVKTSEHLPEMLDVLRTQKLISIPLSDYDKAIELEAGVDDLIDRLELLSPRRIDYAKSAAASPRDRRSYRKNFLVGSIGKAPKRSSNYRGHFRGSSPLTSFEKLRDFRQAAFGCERCGGLALPIFHGNVGPFPQQDLNYSLLAVLDCRD